MRRFGVTLVGLFLIGCGNDEVSGGDSAVDTDLSEQSEPVNSGYSRCADDEAIGGFTIALEEEYTTVSGGVSSGVVPANIPVLGLEVADCQLLEPVNLFCNPACESGMTCDVDGTCIPYPESISVGEVDIDGMEAAVSMEPLPPLQYYNFSGDLPHPGAAPGAELHLYAQGDEPFALLTVGVETLQTAQSSVAFNRDSAATLSWTAAEANENTRIEIEISLANHGGVPAKIACETDDSGGLTIPVELVNALLDIGYSGFPSAKIARVSADTAQLSQGCVAFSVVSDSTLPIEIDGLISCSGDDDCPDGQSCQPDLSCG